MDPAIKAAAEKVWADLQVERHNERMEYIRRIFNADKFIGIDQKILARNPFYYNDLFDHLYDMKLWDLEELDKEMHLICEQYGKILIRNQGAE